MFCAKRKLLHITSILFAVLLFAMNPGESYSAPTEAEFNTILDLSGRQRMLSQKMAKEALLILKGVDAAKNGESLKQTMALFEKTQQGLISGDAALGLPASGYSRINRDLEELNKTYAEVKAIYQTIVDGGKPSDEQMKSLEVLSEEVLVKANKIVGLFELEAKAVIGVKGDQELATLINIAGRQRMLSQKMIKEFLLISLSASGDSNANKLTATITLFETSLKGLKEGSPAMGIPTGAKDPEILTQLNAVEKIWGDLKPLLAAKDAGVDALAKTDSLSLELLKESNKAVQMLAKK
ncbi:MAG: type IV pili methyl-accepting chemotaxis transducer N-terminal domain-containing protein [Deltaproteobacteria bacterium]|nr:type IV pili methyl-accepting chemotaxis transducer N-terminal domain-containing protein [Deltaproteobacteria bacterium]